MTAKSLTDDLLKKEATEDAREFLAANVPDLEQIAAGELPSATSLSFFEATNKTGQVLRYVIYNKDGYSQVVSDHLHLAAVDHSEFELQAANAAKIGRPIVDIRHGADDKQPAYFAVAFVPVVINGPKPLQPLPTLSTKPPIAITSMAMRYWRQSHYVD